MIWQTDVYANLDTPTCMYPQKKKPAMSWSSGKRITAVTTAIRVQFTVGETIYNA